MPIRIPNDLPAVETLQQENIFVMTEQRAITQDIRPLQLLLVNLMPKKIETETQLTRLLGNTPLQVEMELIHTESYESKNVTRDHIPCDVFHFHSQTNRTEQDHPGQSIHPDHRRHPNLPFQQQGQIQHTQHHAGRTHRPIHYIVGHGQ